MKSEPCQICLNASNLGEDDDEEEEDPDWEPPEEQEDWPVKQYILYAPQ